MPYTIPFTTKQRATITAFQTESAALQSRLQAFCAAIVQGYPDEPSAHAKIEITAEGIVVTEPDIAPEPTKE